MWCRAGAISIHALRKEGDTSPLARAAATSYFYPRPPQGGRRWQACLTLLWCRFLSTPSARRATPASRSRCPARKYFYPRPPQGGRPRSGRTARRVPCHFYPRPPQGGRRPLPQLLAEHLSISIHALRKEGDSSRNSPRCFRAYFYPRPPQGGRPPTTASAPMAASISIHALRKEGDRCLLSREGCSIFLSTPSARRATA